jgi:hypothetical protein
MCERKKPVPRLESKTWLRHASRPEASWSTWSRFGRARRLVGYDGPDANPGPDHVAVEQGYILCLHTGFTTVAMKREPDPTAIYNSCAMLDGADVRLLQWISDSSLAAIAADNYAVEAIPARAGGGRRPFVPLRAHCLFKLGVHLELWYLSEPECVVARQGSKQVSADSSAAASAGRRRISCHADRDCLRQGRFSTPELVVACRASRRDRRRSSFAAACSLNAERDLIIQPSSFFAARFRVDLRPPAGPKP